MTVNFTMFLIAPLQMATYKMRLKECPDPSCSETFTSGKVKRRHVYNENHNYRITITHCSLCNEPFLSEGARLQHENDYDHNRQRRRTRGSNRKKKRRSKIKLYSLETEAQLNSFVASEVQIPSSEKASFSSAINELVHFLQNNIPGKLRPKEVIKGGSLGKGTAVKGKSDIDLTLVMNGISDIHSLEQQLPDILSTLEIYLRSNSAARVIGKTRHAVQVELPGHGGERHSIDLLPALDLGFDEDGRRKVYQRMGRETISTQQFYSTSLAPLQIEVTRELPPKVKDLIRLVKYWKKERVTSKTAPTSYVMELVVLHRWERSGSPSNFCMVGALKDVLTSLTQHTSFHVEFGNLRKYSQGMAKPGNGPYIIDPTNPYNDVYHGLYGKPWNWKQVAHEAHVWLQQNIFRGKDSSW